MTRNPILDELRVVRERLLVEAGGTLDTLVDRRQAEERQSQRVQFRPRRTSRDTGAAKSSEMTAENQRR